MNTHYGTYGEYGVSAATVGATIGGLAPLPTAAFLGPAAGGLSVIGSGVGYAVGTGAGYAYDWWNADAVSARNTQQKSINTLRAGGQVPAWAARQVDQAGYAVPDRLPVDANGQPIAPYNPPALWEDPKVQLAIGASVLILGLLWWQRRQR